LALPHPYDMSRGLKVRWPPSPLPGCALRDTAKQCGSGHSIDGHHKGSRAKGDFARLCQFPDLLERRCKEPLELAPHTVDTPLVELPVLGPLEIAYRDSAGIGKDIGEQQDASVGEDVVGIGADRGIRRFDDHL